MRTLKNYSEITVHFAGEIGHVKELFEISIPPVGKISDVSENEIFVRARYGLQMTRLQFSFETKGDQVLITCRGSSNDNVNTAAMRNVRKIIDAVRSNARLTSSADTIISIEEDKKTNSNKKFRNIFFGVLLLGTAIGIRKEGMDFFKQDTVRASSWDHSVDVVETFLKNEYLRDPSSYESVRWGHLSKNSDGTYSVTHTFRARNGFGGMNEQTLTFLISSDGQSIISYQ